MHVYMITGSATPKKPDEEYELSIRNEAQNMFCHFFALVPKLYLIEVPRKPWSQQDDLYTISTAIMKPFEHTYK